jgi:hypothetical protein
MVHMLHMLLANNGHMCSTPALFTHSLLAILQRPKLSLLPVQVAERLKQPAYYGALTLLIDEAGFLMDQKTQALVSKLPQDQAGLVAAGAVLRALGVTDGPGFDALMEALTEGRGE